jgi:HD superfamily phosphohydrolase
LNWFALPLCCTIWARAVQPRRRILEWYADRTKLNANQKKEKIHELVTAHFIRTDPDVGRLLSTDKREQVIKLLADGHGQPALKAIVSGPLDTDKQDYLLRDSYFCGVAYGVLIFTSSTGPFRRGHEKSLMIDPDGIHAVEQYVLAKYYLTTNVYRHRVRLITDLRCSSVPSGSGLTPEDRRPPQFVHV